MPTSKKSKKRKAAKPPENLPTSGEKEKIGLGELLAERVKGAIVPMDDKKLLWCLMASSFWDQPEGSIEATFLEQLKARLYPEFDGEHIRFEKWGWSTPDHDIRYIRD